MAGKKDQLLTLSQAGKRYGYSSDYFRRLAEKGRLSAQKVGHQWLTTADDVKTFSRKPRAARRLQENARTKIIPRFYNSTISCYLGSCRQMPGGPDANRRCSPVSRYRCVVPADVSYVLQNVMLTHHLA